MIVPARDAAATLPRTLAALHRQTVDHEVVVVDDGSSDDTPAIAEQHGARVFHHSSARGPARARNAGGAVANAPLLAFTDADCAPSPGWLEAGVRALREADLVTGPITPERPPGPFDRTLDRPGPSPLYESANLFVTRSMFARVGGFEPFARRPGQGPRGILDGLRPASGVDHFGEDIVFAWRARRAGARVAFAPDARVEHAVFDRGAAAWVAERRRLRYFPALLRLVPELSRELTGKVFLNARTARFDAAAVGVAVALATRRPWPLLAAVPYARAAPRDKRLAAATVVADAVGCGALVGGSLAARRVVL